MATRVFSYDCTPLDNHEVLAAQYQLGHDFYNALVAIKRSLRARFRDLCAACPALADLAHQIEACEGVRIDARAQAADDRVIARSRKGASEESRAICDDMFDALAWLRPELKVEVRAAIKSDPALAAAVDEVEKRSWAEVKEASHKNAAAGLYWGTAGVVMQAIEQARKSHRPPQFRRWADAEGRQVAVSLTAGGHGGGRHVAELFEPNGLIEIEPIPVEAWTGTRGDRRRMTRVTCRMRIGSDEHRAPVWAVLPVVMHRQLPAGGMVTGAKIVQRMVASHEVYQLQITIREPDPVGAAWNAGPAVGIDLGWRWQSEIRVGYQVDSLGEGRSLDVPNNIASALEHAASLASIRGRNMDAMRAGLGEWLKATRLPDWLSKASATLANWRAPGRFAVLAIAWRNQRFHGDQAGYEMIEAWRKQDKHLWEWQANERRKALARRQEGYRVWAAGIASRYSLVCIEEFDLRKLARKPPVEEPGEYDDLARSQRIVSAPSLMRSVLLNACAVSGVTVVKVPCAATTITCHECGGETRWDAAKYRSHRCACGAIWDQDHNAAINILRAGVQIARAEDETPPPPAGGNGNGHAAINGGRWMRRRAEAAERRDARKPQGNAAESQVV